VTATCDMIATLETGSKPEDATLARERMDVVIVGHVDHGKSTVIGRLLADTGSLPKGKLEQVRLNCERNAKPFEYAFLLDALKDEQSQGITIDSARCFFKTRRRDYIIIDAPGHIEFLKNMITGAARAEAALLVIDAKEGIQENSRRHGYLLSLLGISQVVVLVNKMDLVRYDQRAFAAIVRAFSTFLESTGVAPKAFVPISAFEGENLIEPSARMPWYEGASMLETIDQLDKRRASFERAFRMPVQDIYKFTEDGDDRRIIAGTVLSGSARVGDAVAFWPSGKCSSIRTVEGFAKQIQSEIFAGQATGVTLTTQVYVRPGEIMCLADQAAPATNTVIKASVFWLGRQPLVRAKRYKLKHASASTTATVTKILKVIDAANLESQGPRQRVERHEVAECILETSRPLACDLADENPEMGRFVLVDDYRISGGGIITATTHHERDTQAKRVPRGPWHGGVSPQERYARYRQQPKLVLITGSDSNHIERIASTVERRLFEAGRYVYYLADAEFLQGIADDLTFVASARDEHVRRLSEIARLFAQAGCLLLATLPDVDEAELSLIHKLAAPSEVIVVGVTDGSPLGLQPALTLEKTGELSACTEQIASLLVHNEVLVDFEI
jgi:bifunctional enzyme CysN/CysC